MDTDLRRLLDALPGMVWTATPDGTCDFVNERWRDYTGVGLDALAAQGWISLFHPDDVPGAMDAWAATLALERPREINILARIRRADGVYRRLSLQTRPLFDADGHLTGWCGVNTDVEDRTRAEAQLAAEKRLLELVARGMDLPGILEALCIQVEGLSPGSLCSILFVEDDGEDGRRRFRVGAGPKLPEAYNAALDGLKVDPHYGPCSLAVETRSTIIAADPPRDPRWSASPWPGLVTGFGLASCWSAPILGSHGEVLGIFAIYKRAPQGPTDQDEELIDRFARIAGVAIERAQADEAVKAHAGRLRRAHDHLAQAQELTHTGSFTTDLATDTHVWSDELYRILEFEPGAAVSFSVFRALIHPDDLNTFNTGFGATLKTGVDFDAVFRLTTPKGALKYLHAVAKRIEAGASPIFMGSIQDVTESKLAEEALKASEADLRRANRYLAGAQRLSKTGSFSWIVETDEQDWSEELYRIWEMQPEDDRAVSTLHDTILHPEDVPGVEAILTPAVQAGTDYEISYRIITPSGAIKHLHTVNQRLTEITDKLVYVGATQDMTASKQVEEALKAREAELKRVNRYLAGAQTLSRIGSFTLDVVTGDQDWSDENYRIWEFDPATPPTMEMVAETIHPDDRERALATLGAATQKGDDFEVSYRIVTRSGVVKHLRTVAVRIPEIEDRLVFFGSSQDVTEDKLAEEALRASQAELVRANAHLTAAQRLSNTGSFTWDVLADDHHWSDVIYQVFGFEPGCKVTMDMMMAAIHPEDMADVEALIGGAANGENFELVFRIVLAGDELRYAHVMGHRIDQIPDHPVFMGALQDITARKLAEDDLNRARAELAHMSRAAALSTLTASIAHEVSQPLAGILANGSTSSRMLAMDPPNLDGARAAIQRTIRDGQRASEVIKRLRAMFARRPPSFEPVDLHEAAREVLALSASELQRRRVIVRTDFAEAFPPVRADRIQLQQVILNLVLNAVDAMETVDGRPRELYIASRRTDGQVMLDMRDVGQGIEPDNIDQLFDAFHTTKPEGMGIGLSISRSIIEAHGGRLSAAPNPDGSGATFSFSIPCDPSGVGLSTGHA
jgi:PAS domain S-box-containing protein